MMSDIGFQLYLLHVYHMCDEKCLFCNRDLLRRRDDPYVALKEVTLS